MFAIVRDWKVSKFEILVKIEHVVLSKILAVQHIWSMTLTNLYTFNFIHF